MMEENPAISEQTTTNETGRMGVEPLDSELTPEEASLDDGEAEEGPHPDPPPHPMLLSPVLKCMFKHIINNVSSTPQDVRNFRLVCKTWRNEVTLLYRRIQAPTVFERTRGHLLSEMKTFLEVMKNSDMIPVQSYEFREDFFRDDNQQMWKDFLLTCGSDIVSLYLEFHGQHTTESDQTGLANLKLNKLKKLKFHVDRDVGKNRDGHGLVLLLGFLLDSAEALEEFKFYYQQASSRPSTRQPLLKQFEEVISRGLSKTVKILHLPNSLLKETSYNTLAEKGLKLEEFHLDVSRFEGFRENEVAIRTFLEKHANTMKTLRVDGGIMHANYKFPFPGLNELRFLELNRMIVDPFSFTQKFPKLQRLDVDGWDDGGQLPEIISKHFPNITELHVSLYSMDRDVLAMTRALQEVFIHFPNIEQLYIFMCLSCDSIYDADTLFSGVCKDGRKRIRRWEFSKEKFRKEQKMPSILNLTKLKKLEVKHDPAKGAFHLTDFAAYFVFLQMDNLKELSLSMANMSPECIEDLEKGLNLSWKQHDMKSATAPPPLMARMNTLLSDLLAGMKLR